ncbi:AEC family transporter [Neiella marina]|uniref:AEC family transporter n=1 Tax=Neiella holothuriorum TaxID=2870530 RepID=A0ABS7EJR1_9GAMM|nr:AEC family transporter [Neiella holothuriorum]MBW8192598.1 AEC family transporter [Neiella holothuriorum]
MFQAFGFSLSVTTPILLMMVLGYIFRQRAMISQEFIRSGSKLVFNVTLPCLLFLNIATADVGALIQPKLLSAATAITVGSCLLLWWYGRNMGPAQRGVFVQGCFRGNMGIIGLATIVNAFGNEALAPAGIYLAIISIVYNLTAIVVLSAAQERSEQSLLLQTIRSTMTNPLLLAIAAGLVLALLGWRLPDWLTTSGRYLANMTLPLALLCVGGSLSLDRLKGNRSLIIQASAVKLVLLPAFSVVCGALLGFSGMNLGILYLMMATPSATASFVMAQQMNGDADLAADIIAVTTVLAVVTTTIGLLALRALNLI